MSPLESSVFFEEFWLAYPKKTAKGFARKAYDRALGRITHPEIMAGLAKYKFPSQTKFAPKPENWLDGDCWMDQKDGYFSETDSERQQWALRINGWKEKKFWLAKWGDPPGSPNCQCPKDLLAA